MRPVLLICLFAAALPALSKDLPLVEVPARGARPTLLAVMISGDGGWAKIDKEIAGQLSERGIGVVGLNALDYFWTKRTPDELASDVASIIERYLQRWDASQIVLIGYSRGADLLPFAVTRLPEPLRRSVVLVALLSPGKTTQFEFKVTDWFKSRGGVPTLPEIEKMRGTRTICVYGTDDSDTVCTVVDPRIATPVALAGSHHFDGDYPALAKLILSYVSRK